MGLAEEFTEWIGRDELLKSIISDRLDIGRVQQGRAYPCAVVYDIFTEPYHELAGESGMSRTTLQLDFWDDGADGLLNTKRAAYRVRAMLANGYVGTFLDNGLHVSNALVRRLDLLAERPRDGSDDIKYRASLDIEIIHQDPTADVETPLPELN